MALLQLILILFGVFASMFCKNFESAFSTSTKIPNKNNQSALENRPIRFTDEISPLAVSSREIDFRESPQTIPRNINFTVHVKTQFDINFEGSSSGVSDIDMTGFDAVTAYGDIPSKNPPVNFPPVLAAENDQYEPDQETEILHQQLLDKTLTRFMHMKRPSFAEGTFQFFPKPYITGFLPDLGALKQLLGWGTHTVNSYATCYACKVGFGLFLTKARTRTSLEDILNQAIFGCGFFGIAAPEVCSGLVNRFAPILHYIGTSRRDITAATFCGIALQSSGCTTNKGAQTQWNIDLENYPSRRLKSNQILFDDLAPVEFPKNMKTLKVLHLTDIHVDPEYSPGSNTDCFTELCCRQSAELPEAGNKAGYFGSYNKCDLPYHSFIDALQHISKTHPDIGLIYFTGDINPHDIWNTSSYKNTENIQIASSLIRQYFPNVKILPVLGNHEPHPVNLYSPVGVPHQFSTDWIYGVTANAWGDWIPKESIHNFLHAGFYDAQISDKFRVVVLNTNLCYTYNFWQVYDHHDPGGQLRWLVRLLQTSEKLGEKVHILGHVPPSQEECWSVWGRNFYQIINRFKSTVKAQFYGHTHFDSFQLYYNEKYKHEAINPIWIGASLTPFINLNPGYKIFTVDGARGEYSTWSVLDHETWIYNLTEANTNPVLAPRWFKLYQATEAFEIPDVLPHSLNNFVHRMSANATWFDKYYSYYHKDSDVALKKTCDVSCRKRILCSIVTPYYSEQTECLKIKSEVDGVILPKVIFERVPPPTSPAPTLTDHFTTFVFGR